VSSFATNSEWDAMVREMRFTAGRGTVTGRVLLERQTVHVADIAAYPDYDVPETVTVGGIRTMLAVPLLREDEPIGVIVLTRSEIDPFNERQIELVRTFADQAVIAIENARLITETREALEQQTATAEVLQVINSSPGDLAPVFDAMLDRAMRLCEADFGILLKYDGGRFYPGALRGVPEAYAELVTREPLQFDPGSAIGRIECGELLVHYTDAATEDATRSIPLLRTFQELGGIRSFVAIALRRDVTLLGVFVIYRQEVRPFTDKQIALLQNFAAQAVIAMENARLITETREALERQTATAEILAAINSSPGDLQPVFDEMLEKAMRLCDAAFGLLLVPDGELQRAIAHRALPPALAEYLDRPVHGGVGLVGRLQAGEAAVQIADAADDEIYRAGAPSRRAIVDLGGARTAMAVALRKDATYLGGFWLYRQEVRPFTDKQIALLQNFAAQAVIAMENARLLGELRQRTADLEESLEYQTATSDMLKVISRSTFDLQPVLQTVAEAAARLCEADTTLIMRRDGELYRAAAQISITPEFIAHMQSHPITPNRGSIVGRVVLEGQTVHIADLTADPEYTVTETVATNRVRTLLGVPLLREGVPIGVITLGRRTVRPFTEKQIALVATFADQAVIAIENARLLGELRQRTDEIAGWNRELEARVAEQVEELGRVGRLKRFLAPQLAELIVSQGDEKILESHRREIVVVFCDLRGYTAFTETAEPEEVLKFLREYHGALGPLVSQFEGTLDQFSGDGIMVFFNDPVPCPDPAERAVKMAVAMREEAGRLITVWRRHGCELGFGAGIAQGYATLGQIGFSERSGYTAIGTVCNLAARLCAEANDGQILVSSHIAEAVEAVVRLEDLGNLELKGLRRPVAAFNVVQSTSPAEARPNLTVVASREGPGGLIPG
jgi:GAF domain-containing protein